MRSAGKFVVLALWLGAAFAGTGCMTTISTYNYAKGRYTWPSAPVEKLPPLEPKPGFYALLPLTVPFDIATAPVQAPLFVMWLTMPEPEASPFDDE